MVSTWQEQKRGGLSTEQGVRCVGVKIGERLSRKGVVAWRIYNPGEWRDLPVLVSPGRGQLHPALHFSQQTNCGDYGSEQPFAESIFPFCLQWPR